MIIDTPTCEWRPGSDRSVVSIEQAAPRIAPPATAAKLIAAFNGHRPDDIVAVRWGSIDSSAGHAYGPAIHNMNHGEGGLCRKVTRLSWSDKEQQNGMVYIVDGRAWVWFAVCGNLAEIDLLASAPPAAALVPESGEPIPVEQPGTPPEADRTARPVDASGPESAVPFAAVPALNTPAAGIPGLCCTFGGGGIPWVPPLVPSVPAAPIPEPATWLLLVAGAGLLSLRLAASRPGSCSPARLRPS